MYEFIVDMTSIHEAVTTPIFTDKKDFLYLYDFGDTWMHTIKILDELEADPDVAYPICVGGKRACPPEDCGGVAGYRRILRNRKGFDPNNFTVEWANERLLSFDLVNGQKAKKRDPNFTVLIQYIVALTNLYGILPKEELIRTFNTQNKTQITLDTVNYFIQMINILKRPKHTRLYSVMLKRI